MPAVAKRRLPGPPGKTPPPSALTVPSFPKGVGEEWELERIKPYPNNPRIHPDDQIKLLTALLLRYGPDQAIVVDEDGVILKGHGRLISATAAREVEERFKTFPVIQRFGLSDADKQAIRIADNQVSLLSGWDDERLRLEVIDLKMGGFPEMGLLGFTDVRLDQIEAGGPDAPDQFREVGEDIETDYCCPSCGYSWSGAPKPKGEKKNDGKPLDKSSAAKKPGPKNKRKKKR